ncbi:SPASM domain-containing protein [Candidatus Sumerlaeota bacterium]|nr:SPASM domain-containing protein [Candidatus Sumerlaeota bacterium]
MKPHLALKNLISAAAQSHDVEHHDFTAASPRMPEEKKVYKTTDVHGFNGTNVPFDGEALSSDLDMRNKTLVEKCHYPWYFMLIDTDGDVRPCCWAGTSWGNLNQLSFDEVWNGEGARTMRQKFLNNDIPQSCRGKHCRVDL